MFSFGVAHPDDPFLKGKQIQIWQSERKEHFMASRKRETEFFKSNMDALTVLFIWDTAI